LALRTQQIIAHESGVAHTVDPLGGSYCIEKLTDRIEAQAAVYIEKIDEMGGVVRAIEQRYPQDEIEQSSYRYQQQIERRERVIVGVNRYTREADTQPEILTISEKAARRQIDRLSRVRAQRDASAVTRALTALEAAARNDTNLMPLILDAVQAYASVGEICDALRRVFGEYEESTV